LLAERIHHAKPSIKDDFPHVSPCYAPLHLWEASTKATDPKKVLECVKIKLKSQQMMMFFYHSYFNQSLKHLRVTIGQNEEVNIGLRW